MEGGPPVRDGAVQQDTVRVGEQVGSSMAMVVPGVHP